MIHRDSGQDRARVCDRSLLASVGTNCPKIIRLVSGRTHLMSKGTVCAEIWLYARLLIDRERENKEGG